MTGATVVDLLKNELQQALEAAAPHFLNDHHPDHPDSVLVSTALTSGNTAELVKALEGIAPYFAGEYADTWPFCVQLRAALAKAAELQVGLEHS